MEPSDKLLFGIYARYSSSKQSNGISLEYQVKLCQQVIQECNGSLVNTFIDKEKSGYHLSIRKREGMVNLIEAIKSGQINSVVFFEESRMSRRILDFYTEFLEPILEVNPNIRFYKASTGKQWDPSSDEAKRELIAALRESQNKSQLAKRTQEILLSEGKRPGGRMPLGIEAIIEKRLICNQELIIVLFIFHLASWGYSERAIAGILKDIEENRDRSENRDTIDQLDPEINNYKGKTWNHTSVHYILNNPIYIGIAAWDRRTSKHNSSPKSIEDFILYNSYEPVIPKQLWDLAHSELNRKSIGKNDLQPDIIKGKIRMDTSFLLSSIIQCSHCNTFLLTKNSLKKGEQQKQFSKKGLPLKYYFCPNCNYRIDSNVIELLVLDHIKAHLNLFISELLIEDKIRQWQMHLTKQIYLEQENLEWKKIQQTKIDHLYGAYPIESKERLKEIARNEINRVVDRVTELHHLIEELKKLKEEKLLNLMVKRINYLTSKEEELLGNVEKRYLLLSIVEKLLVRKAKSGKVEIHLLEYKDLPLPNFFDKLKEQAK